MVKIGKLLPKKNVRSQLYSMPAEEAVRSDSLVGNLPIGMTLRDA